MPRTNSRRGAVVATAALSAIALGLGAAPASATVNLDGSVTVDLLNITDFHGALEQAPNIAAQVDAFRALNPDTIFSSAGDSIGGSTFESAIQQDEPTIEVLNQAGLQVSAVGNHEFDQGFDDLSGRVTALADFPYLAANVTGQTALAPYEIITVSGVDVAYIGTVTQTTPTIVSPGGIEGLTFGDPVAATNQFAALLSDGVDSPESPEADVVVALLHEGTNVVASTIGADVDAVFTGHSHETIPSAATPTVPAGVAPTTASGAPIVQAGASGTVLGRIQLTVDLEGDITYGVAANIPVTAFDGESAAGPVDPAIYDQEVADTVRQAFADAAVQGNEPVGEVAAPFNAASNAGTANTGTPQHRGAESPLGNLLAEIYVATVNDFGLEADFGIMNPGGIRADLDPNADGIVTFREAFNVTSFSNTVGTVDLTGAQVDTLLEQQFEARPPRPMLALGLSPELSYLYDPTAPVGSRVGDIAVDGGPIVADATYTVASNTFLLEGADGFTVLGEGTNLQETGVIDWQATIDFFEANGELTPSYVQQSIGVTEVTDLDQVFAPGAEITVDLSSLSFTSTEPKPTLVTAYVLGSNLPLPTADVTAMDVDVPAADPGTVIGEAPVDNANVTDSNETGRATVTFTVPEDTVDGPFTVAYVSSGEGEGLEPQLVAALTVTVAAAVEPTDPPVDPSPSAPAPTPSVDPSVAPGAGGSGTLPETGAEAGFLPAAIALMALLAGAGLLVLRRRTAA